ncbi:hypothetical protein [Actinoplanes ianthinogenes]|uniref:hypothetical protein n=1 Tax=Actinoplanes ianthinogenes TaxID=122358 RepID=UPI00166FDB47|nr:hypothetical protein [Actinoplanes ianthinogenes]
MLTRFKIDKRLVFEALLIVALLAVAGLARYAGRREWTADMRIFVVWYQKLQASGGWSGLGEEIGNYNAPFLYLLQFSSVLPGAVIFKIKMVYTAFDVLLGFFTYKLVDLRWGRRAGIAGALLMVLLPTVVINASFYGQMDAMWASFAVGGVYFLIRRRPWLGVAFCTVALAFKPQGIFIFPLLGVLVVLGVLRLRHLLIAPAVWVLLDLPALLLGRDPWELFTIYSLGRQSVNVPALTQNAPSVFVFFPISTRIDSVRPLGYVFTAALVLGLTYVLLVRRVRMTATQIVTVGALFAILVPFFLPGMHERYFFLADVLTVLLAIYRPRLWYVPILVQAGSLLAYEPFLFGPSARQIDKMIPATLMLVALIATAYTLLREACDETGTFTEPATAERAEPERMPAGSAAPVTPRPRTAPGTAGLPGTVEEPLTSTRL